MFENISKQDQIRRFALFAIAAIVLLAAQNVQAGSSSSSSGSSSGGSSTQSQYNSYVAQNACGCYSSSAVSYAQSGGNVQSVNAQTPGYYGSSSGGNTYGGSGSGSNTLSPSPVYNGTVTNAGGARLTYTNGQLTSVSYTNGLTVTNISGNYVGATGYAFCSSCGGMVSVTYMGAPNGTDNWQYSQNTSGSGSGSSFGGSGSSSSGSSSGGSSSGGSSSSSGGGGGTIGGGHYEQQCTSSGKGGQTCKNVWVPDSKSGGTLCTSATCDSGSSSSSGGGSTPVPTALSIDASPRLIKNGDSSTISWTSTNAQSCAVTGPKNFSASGTSGSAVAANITEQSTYTLTCQFASGSRQMNVVVNIIPLWREY